jgi:hypothetical protein
MKKIRLTEKDLTNIIKRVINEQSVNEKNVNDCISAMKSTIINMMDTIVNESKKQKLVSTPTEEEWNEAQKRILREL